MNVFDNLEVPVVSNFEIHLIKPHGSVSWRYILDPRGPHIESLNVTPSITPMKPEDVKTGGPQPFVLGAVPIKSELIKEVQQHTEAFEVVASQWQALVRMIREAEEVIVVGYSFSIDDGYGEFLFREAVHQRPGAPIRTVTFWEMTDKQGPLGKRLAQIFQPQEPPHWEGEVTPADP